jgi:hypothetical protein
MTASGDLYAVRKPVSRANDLHSFEAFHLFTDSVMPVFPIDNYAYYISATSVQGDFALGKKISLLYELWAADLEGDVPNWSRAGIFRADLMIETSPAQTLSQASYAQGTVKDSNGNTQGSLSILQISRGLRAATIEIDCASGLEAPINSGDGQTWKSVFQPLGWDITIKESHQNIEVANDGVWSDGDLHAAMLEFRDRHTNLNVEWRYYILVVNKLASNPRGVMFDASSTDSNKIPREGIAMASDWEIPNEAVWGNVRGVPFGKAKAAFFRTAMHELGHAMGLNHNDDEKGIMMPTDEFVNAIGTGQFPDNIIWKFSARDSKWLSHAPDICVRPGGIRLIGSLSDGEDDRPTESQSDLQLNLKLVTDNFPLGAPVRMEITLLNASTERRLVPTKLSMKYGLIKGRVIDASGKTNLILPAIVYFDRPLLAYADPGEGITGSLTLMRGKSGPLFPSPGSYTLEIQITWRDNGVNKQVLNSINVDIAFAQNDQQERIAHDILKNPDVFLSLLVTGDHLEEGNKIVKSALADSVLRDHYSFIEAKRLASNFGKRKADLEEVSRLITFDTVMTKEETKKITGLLKNAKHHHDLLIHNIMDVLRIRRKNV